MYLPCYVLNKCCRVWWIKLDSKVEMIRFYKRKKHIGCFSKADCNGICYIPNQKKLAQIIRGGGGGGGKCTAHAFLLHKLSRGRGSADALFWLLFIGKQGTQSNSLRSIYITLLISPCFSCFLIGLKGSNQLY